MAARRLLTTQKTVYDLKLLVIFSKSRLCFSKSWLCFSKVGCSSCFLLCPVNLLKSDIKGFYQLVFNCGNLFCAFQTAKYEIQFRFNLFFSYIAQQNIKRHHFMTLPNAIPEYNFQNKYGARAAYRCCDTEGYQKYPPQSFCTGSPLRHNIHYRREGHFLLTNKNTRLRLVTTIFTRPGDYRQWDVKGIKDGVALIFEEEFLLTFLTI